MGILSTNVELSETVDLPGYQVNTVADSNDIETLVSYLNSSKKPLVLAGAGINHSKSNELLTNFVTQHKIPTVATLLGLGAVPYNHPYF